MKKYLLFILTAALCATLAATAPEKRKVMKETENQLPQPHREAFARDGLCTYKSRSGAGETADRILQILKSMEIPVFAVFDHAKNAAEAGLPLPPATVIVFGSPQVGTALMQENPAVTIELPLKIAVWDDGAGNVWVAFPDMPAVAARYGLENHPVIAKMQKLLENIAGKAVAEK